jgi:HSP20 family protein
MRFGTHKGNYGYAPFFKVWADACGTDWQEKLQEVMQFGHPAVNIVDNESDFTLEVAAPGLQKEDFNIEVKNDKLTIWTEVRKQENAKKYARKEFGFGNFKRTFTLSDKVDTDNISARYTDGILYVVLPKIAQPKTGKNINID